MLVFEIIQNDGLLCEQALSLFVFCLLSITFYILHMNTLFCVRTYAQMHLNPSLVMCQWLLIMRFLQDGKLQGD